MNNIQKIRFAFICIALSISINGCNSKDPLKELAESCLEAYGKENLKDPQGAYLIDYKKEKSNEIVISYSALNGMGGRERGVARCGVKNNYELDTTSNGTFWLLDRIDEEERQHNK